MGSVGEVAPGVRPVVRRGVVIVHGVGEQGRGDYIGSFVEPLASFVADGLHHILIGWDHLAFLALLVLPAVWRRWREPAMRFCLAWALPTWPVPCPAAFLSQAALRARL